MNNKNKKRLGILLVIFGFILSGVSFAYWADSFATIAPDTDNVTIVIGKGNEVTTTVTLNDNYNDTKLLVPAGRVVNATTQTDEVEFTLEVKWESTDQLAENANGKLALTLDSKNIGGSAVAAINNHVELKFVDELGAVRDVSALDIVADGAAVLVKVKITLTEPQNKTDYLQIAEENINLVFKAVVTVNP